MSAVPLCFGNKTFVLFKSDGGLYDISKKINKKTFVSTFYHYSCLISHAILRLIHLNEVLPKTTHFWVGVGVANTYSYCVKPSNLNQFFS